MNACINDPTQDTKCPRCGNNNAIWDIGLCWNCVDESLNEDFAVGVISGKIRRQLIDLLLFVDSLEDASTETRRKYLQLVEALKH